MEKILFTAAIFVTTWLTIAWNLMLTVGTAHDTWWHVIPLMNYGQAAAITSPVLIGMIVALIFKVLGDD